MALTYFNDNDWINISREERLYCAHLYFQIRGKELKFVRWLNKNKGMSLPTNCNWEIGYEVCFYRDYLKNVKNKSIRVENRNFKDNPYSEKRTFDLCLFSEDTIVIIEAKVKEHFGQAQLDDTKEDESLIPRVLEKDIKVINLLLAQSKYIESKNFLRTKKNRSAFPYVISWREMDELFPNDVFERADELK